MRKEVILVVFLLVFSSLSFAKVVDVQEVSEGEEVPIPLQENEEIVRYFYSGNSLVYSSNGEEGKYYFQDRLGNNRISVNQNGEVFNFKSLPYGQVIQDGIQYGFTGKEKDSESGLHYFGARYYDSDLGRFTSVDPIAGNNPYAYVANNPLMLVDPDGFAPIVADTAFLVENFGMPKDSGTLMWSIERRIHSGGPIDMVIPKEVIADYLGLSEDLEIQNSAIALLKNFQSATIQLFEGGSIRVKASDDLVFPINGIDPLSVDVQMSKDLRLTTLSYTNFMDDVEWKVISGTEETIEFIPTPFVSTVLRVDSGQISIKPGRITAALAGIGSLFGVDKADMPQIEKAKYLMSLGSAYSALFDAQGNQIGDIRDKNLGKRRLEDLPQINQEEYNLGLSRILQDLN